MGGDWQQVLQSVLIGLVLSFLIAKLISFITAFKEANSNREVEWSSMRPVGSLGDMSEVASRVSDDFSVLAEKGSQAGGDADHHSDYDFDDDDWEGLETTQLHKSFTAATAFVAASDKLPNEVHPQFYALHKIATEGPCALPAPPAFKRTARAKWNAWQKLGAMPPEDAMQKYIDILTHLFPSWPTAPNKTEIGDTHAFNALIRHEESGNELKMDAIHTIASKGDIDELLKCIESGFSVNLRDSEGRTPLHWAVNRGHLGVIELLLSKNADVNAKDNEGQTALHYAVVCDREAIAEYLVNHNADIHAKDNKGASPSGLCEKHWPWIRPVDEVVC